MPEFVLKYADPRGEVHQQVAEAGSEKELRDRYAQQGFLIYSIRARHEIAGVSMGGRRKKKINLEKFLLSDAFARQGVFPPIYVTSVLAGEKSGALGEVLDRFIHYQKLALAVRKKLLLSLVYPCVLIVLVICLMVFLVTFVVPKFAELYNSMSAKLPMATEILIMVGTTARSYILGGFIALVAAFIAFRYWAKTEKGEVVVDRWRLHTPLLGEIWIKYQVAQFSRVLGTLLVGGIPLLQALDTAASSLGTRLLKTTLSATSRRIGCSIATPPRPGGKRPMDTNPPTRVVALLNVMAGGIEGHKGEDMGEIVRSAFAARGII
jgi:type IV pilus assembly protein PilC